jgi:hypothetical protein
MKSRRYYFAGGMDGYLCFNFLLKHQKKHSLPPDAYEPHLIKPALLTYTACKTGSGAACSHRKLGAPLGEVARFCLANSLPPLNALVINATTKRPGDEYLGTDNGTQWARDVYAVLAFDYPPELSILRRVRPRR